ncbi:MAG: CocE/NonD family hydrolase C-terminal non-catalytic domain-containing protein [Solirubrobacterales bacterium]
MRSRLIARALGGSIALAVALASASTAHAAIPGSLSDPGNCEQIEPAPGATVFKCDDGLPNGGGLIPNFSGAAAVTVPAKYGGDGYSGLPPGDGSALDPGADAAGNVSLDVNVWLPSTAPPEGGYPLLVFMHGCCGGNRTGWEADSVDAGGEKWHYNSAWFASRGYLVVTYTARGFVDNQNRGSSGQTQLDSRRYEINDYQHLACQVLAGASAWDPVTGRAVAVDPRNVVVTGGSYGGGFGWLALTDPRWTCDTSTGAAGTEMRLAVVAPKYGWTDLAYTLVPNGTHSQLPGELPAPDGCDTGPRRLDGSPCPDGGAPVGVPKTSIVSGLFLTGNLVTGNHTTFPGSLTQGFVCTTLLYPIDVNPGCGSFASATLPEFMRDRSAYYQNEFFARIASDPGYRVPVFNAGTFTDPLFPSYETRRMANRLLATVPRYPIRSVFGDYQHFTRNKAMEWGDICDSGDARGRHVCELRDYPGGDLDATPPSLVRTGITTRLNEFLDHYAQPSANPSEPRPAFDVTATLRTCVPAGDPGGDEPGEAFTAPTFEKLAPNSLRIDLPGERTTTSKVLPNVHALEADPVLNQQLRSNECVVETDPAGTGVATYESSALPSEMTMIGATEVEAEFTLHGPATGLQLNARLYDLAPDGTATMVDRGPRRVSAAEADAGRVAFQLHGQAWRFAAGHRIRLELAQDDQPFVRATDVGSSLELAGARLTLPVREGGGRCAIEVRGTKRADRLIGTSLGERIRGRKGRDRLDGRGGRDCVSGGKGRDRVEGGRGRDLLKGGRGNDRLKAADGKRDRVRCGPGRRDRATVDRRDRVRGCEHVRVKKRRR